MQQTNKRKKILFLLVVAAFPLAVGLGGYLLFIKNNNNNKTPAKNASAFNSHLPGANLSETPKNKLELYMEAQQEAIKKQELLRQDSISRFGYDPTPPKEIQQEQLDRSYHNTVKQYVDPNEKKINDRLEKLTHELNQPSAYPVATPVMNTPVIAGTSRTAELEAMLASIQNTSTEQDPEIAKLESIVNKIVQIQDPSQANTLTNKKATEKRDTALAVATTAQKPTYQGNGFFGLNRANKNEAAPRQSTILATTLEQQVVASGSTVTLRLLQDVFITGTRVPKGSAISGICNISNQRININLSGIIYNGSLFPVQLEVYDLDGMPGLQLHGAASTQVLKDNTDQAIQSLNMLNYDPSLAAQAATAGVQTMKNLLSRKVRVPTATIKAGHKLFLKMSTL